MEEPRWGVLPGTGNRSGDTTPLQTHHSSDLSHLHGKEGGGPRRPRGQRPCWRQLCLCWAKVLLPGGAFLSDWEWSALLPLGAMPLTAWLDQDWSPAVHKGLGTLHSITPSVGVGSSWRKGACAEASTPHPSVPGPSVDRSPSAPAEESSRRGPASFLSHRKWELCCFLRRGLTKAVL